MCRYLNTAQALPICGLDNSQWIYCAVILGQTLYVMEPHFHTRRVFMYDLNDSDIRLKNRRKRTITCSNKHPLLVNGLVGDVEIIVPCPHTNTLCFLEYHPNLDKDAVVHRGNLDGTVLSRWSPDQPDYSIRSCQSFWLVPGGHQLPRSERLRDCQWRSGRHKKGYS